MKSFKERYNRFAEKFPNFSSYLCFAEVIKHHKYDKEKINYWFNKLVDTDDYARKEKKQIVEYLVKLSNPNSVKMPSGKPLFKHLPKMNFLKSPHRDDFMP